MKMVIGPRRYPALEREIGGVRFTCYGCPALRIHDFHYFYCRHLGDHSLPDEWPGGGRKLISYANGEACGLPDSGEVFEDKRKGA